MMSLLYSALIANSGALVIRLSALTGDLSMTLSETWQIQEKITLVRYATLLALRILEI